METDRQDVHCFLAYSATIGFKKEKQENKKMSLHQGSAQLSAVTLLLLLSFRYSRAV